MRTRLKYDASMTDVSEVASLVFGELVKLTAPVLQAYHSDLYHDALWLSANLKGRSVTFPYSYDNCGTSLVSEPKIAVRLFAYRVTVSLDDYGTAWLELVNVRDEAASERV